MAKPIWKTNKNYIFVGMPFAKGAERRFDVIKEEAKFLKLLTVRVDSLAGGGSILSETFKLIENSDLLIFDLTGNRPNVYLEIGYALGATIKPKEMLLIAQEGTPTHFNVSSYRVVYFKGLTDLRAMLRKNLRQLKKLHIE